MKLGSLCTGTGGLDLAVEAVLGTELAWTSDIDNGAAKIINHRFPGVRNLGDMTTVDWDDIEPVDVITAGYPCQPFSHAGRRKGTDDVRHLWPYIREAVRRIRPRLTVLENVAGHRSLGFDRVLGDMAEDGLDVRWASLRAADVGACHGRERLFIVITDPAGERLEGTEPQSLGLAVSEWSGDDSGDTAALLPTPAVNDMGAGKTPDQWDAWTDDMRTRHKNGNGHVKSLAIEAQRLLPTPSAQEPGYTGPLVDGDGEPAEHVAQRVYDPMTGRLVQTGLEQAARLLPTPQASEAAKAVSGQSVAHREGGGHQVWLTNVAHDLAHENNGEDVWGLGCSSWGQYQPAVHRWESVLGRPAPAPTEPTGKGGAHRLSPRAVEWMMGLPDGWVTDVPGLTRNEQLKALGNGVVPQQAEAALRMLLPVQAVAA